MAPRPRQGRPRRENRISYNEAAAILGVTKFTIVRWVKDGTLPAHVTKAGYHKLRRDEVMALASRREANK